MHELVKYQKIFKIDFGVDCKSFCNYYHDFYQNGQLLDSTALIRPRHLNYTGHVRVPLPTQFDPNHYMSIVVQQ